MNDEKKPGLPEGYTPAKVWKWEQESGGQFANINRPIAGATKDIDLPIGEHPLQLYSLATPNGVKVTVMLEELLAAGHSGAEYDAWLVKIGDGEQFGSGFVAANPNSKIPALMDHSISAEDGGPTRVFESASILLYLAEKFGAFIPTDHKGRTECMDVLDQHLAENEFMAGSEYSIADMAIWPWYGGVAMGRVYDAVEFLDATSYKHLNRWASQLDARPAVQRGRRVNKVFGPEEEQMAERHSSADFDN